MAHFAHYLRRNVVQVPYRNSAHPWFADNQPEAQGFDGPAFHVTRSIAWPAASVTDGDTIWLFAQLYSPWGKLPPALDGRIKVAKARKVKTGGYRFEAGPGSVWFPLFDATKCLIHLTTRNADGSIRSLLTSVDQPVGQALQGMREIADVTRLERFAAALSAKPFEFVSYRLVDGTRAAFERTRTIVENGRCAFWDRWSLPRRLAERRELLEDPPLNLFICRKIIGASKVWGIASPEYGAPGSYSEMERDLALARGNLRLFKPGRTQPMRPAAMIRPQAGR